MSSSRRKPETRSERRRTLTSSVRSLPGIGSKRLDLLRSLGIETIGDLLVYAPRRYLDRAAFSRIAELRPGQVQSIIARIRSVEIKPAKGRRLLVVTAEDTSGRMRCVWFNQPYLRHVFRVGMVFVFSGPAKKDSFGASMVHPEFEKAESELLHTGRIVPVYPTTRGLSQKQLRKLVKIALDMHAEDVEDCLPESARARLDLPALASALKGVHFPASTSEAEASRRRLAFDEVMVFQTLFAKSRLKRKGHEGSAEVRLDTIERFSRRLAFTLTASQVQAVGDILGDMASRVPMRRLLQGDVGCGKTAVAMIAAAVACENRAQVAFMCPTEILAEQHFETMRRFLDPFGFKVGLLCGSMGPDERGAALASINDGTAHVAVGTHALLGEEARFKNLRLAIVDEEQRFGVLERQRMLAKAPDANLLVVSATPIPRTLALTAYGDLDVTTIPEMPPGRGKHVTAVVEHADRRRVLEEVAGRIALGLKGFYVCPAVDEGDGGLVDVGTAAREVGSVLGGEHRVGILTGRSGREDRCRILDDFRSGRLAMIVATTVIEVGMDIPSATLLVVDQADRFGLSQLHQMRGRVARTKMPSFSYFLVSEDAADRARDRILVLESSFDGFEIAERDLAMRGPGDVIGTRQHGVPDLRFARLPGDTDLMLAAREEAFRRVLGEDSSPEWRRWAEAVSSLADGALAVI